MSDDNQQQQVDGASRTQEPLRVIFRDGLIPPTLKQPEWQDNNPQRMQTLSATEGAVCSRIFKSLLGNDFLGDPVIVEGALRTMLPKHTVRMTPGKVTTRLGVGRCFVVAPLSYG